MKREIPNTLFWHFTSYDLKGKRYLEELDFIKEHLDVNRVAIAVVNDVQLQNYQQN